MVLRRPSLIFMTLVTAWVLLMALSRTALLNESNIILGRDISWLWVCGGALIFYAPWTLLSPILLLLFRRFSFKDGPQFTYVIVHLLAGVLLSTLKWYLEDWANRRLSFFIRPLSLSTIMLESINYFTLLIGYTCITYYRRYREKENRASLLESRLAQAQLRMLKMQLNPHFLFNTLHAITSLVHDNPDAAEKMISRLSDLLRLSLDSGGTQKVSLKNELEFVDRYLEIEQIRFEGRLNISKAIEGETLDAAVPNLILQPLVENAIKHGFERSAESCKIRLAATFRDGNLVLEVSDNGRGIAEGDGAPQSGLGLNNVRSRLEYLYGERASMKFEASTEGGASVRLTLPFERLQGQENLE